MAGTSSSSKQNQWLVGCGSGCVVIVLIFVGLGFLGARFVRQTTQGFEAAIETRQDLEQRFGAAESYIPAPDGAIAPERLEAFLAVREATNDSRARLSEVWAEIPISSAAAREIESQGFVDKMQSTFTITRAGLGLGAKMGALFEARNQAMAEAGIGFGEYTYIYALAYYSWLGHPPEEGPETASGDGEASFGPQIGNAFLGRVRDDLLQILRNQLAGVPEGEIDEAWRQALSEEIAAVASDTRRLPWQDGLPEVIAASLEPYRERLEATYSPATNAFELGRNSKRGRFSITAE